MRFLGGRAEYYSEWKEAYSEQVGAYKMTLQYVPQTHRRLVIRVNHAPVQVLEKELQTDVSKANNPYGWASDLDGFILQRMGE